MNPFLEYKLICLAIYFINFLCQNGN